MDRSNGARPPIYQGASNTPYPSPESPKFASCNRLPPAQTPHHTWAEVFGYLGTLFLRLGVTILSIGLLIQIILHGYFKVPTAGPNVPGLRTHYFTLGIEPLANQEEIREAWQNKERSLHPDVVGNTEESREAYYWIQLAYVELSDPLARCYHDQYHGFLSRKFGTDDPCTAILIERERDARQKDKAYGRADGGKAFSSSDTTRDKAQEKIDSKEDEEWISVLKALENSKRKTTAKARKQELIKEYGTLVEQLEEVLDWISPWPFILLGFFFGLVQLLIEYIDELSFKYEWRRRMFKSIFLS